MTVVYHCHSLDAMAPLRPHRHGPAMAPLWLQVVNIFFFRVKTATVLPLHRQSPSGIMTYHTLTSINFSYQKIIKIDLF